MCTYKENHSGRTINRRRLVLSAALAAGLLTTGQIARQVTQAAENVSLALDWYPNANHAGIFLAEERGYFADADLELDAYTPSDPTTVLQTVGAGRDDFGISYQTDVLLARAQGIPVVSVAALVQQPLLTVMALKQLGLRSPQDLVGQSIGYPGIPSQKAILETMLEETGATLDDVDLVNIGFNLVPALISGQVNAVLGGYWTHETILAEQEGYPVDFLRVEDWGVPKYYELVVVTSEDTVSQRPDVVAEFLTPLQHGYTDSIAEPDEALSALKAAYPEIDTEVERQGIALLSQAWIADAPYFGFQSSERWQAYADWMISKELIGADIDISAAFDTELLPVPDATPTVG